MCSEGRTSEYRRQIRTVLGYREATHGDSEAVARWLQEQIVPHEHRLDHLITAALERFRDQRIEPPSQDRIERFVRSAANTFEEESALGVLQRLPAETGACQ